MYSAAILTVGDEILRGRILDRNFQWLSRQLFNMGIEVVYHEIVPDKLENLVTAFKNGVLRADIIITTGGLGPTPDDITRNALANFLNVKMIYHKEIEEKNRIRFSTRGLVMPENNRIQCYVPENGIAVNNPEGTAPGIFYKQNKTLILLLPGPPVEMKVVFENAKSLFKIELSNAQKYIFTFKTIGVPESILESWISKLPIPKGVEISYYPSLKGVDIVASVDNHSQISEINEILDKLLNKYTFSRTESERIEEVIGKILKDRGETLSVAESCTGGMLASRIVDIPGSSNYFFGGIVSYSNEVKRNFLGVSQNNLIKYGAVSPKVAVQMAIGIKKNIMSTYGIGITGIAGPDGGIPEKPVGLVYISLATPDKVYVRKYTFVGSRNTIRTRTTTAALNMLWVILKWGDIINYRFEDGGKFIFLSD